MKNKLKKILKIIFGKHPEKTKLGRIVYGYIYYRSIKKKKLLKQTYKKYYPKRKTKGVRYNIIISDLVFSKKFYRCDNDEYFMYNFYHKSNKKRKNFITSVQKRSYIHLLNSEESVELLNDKFKTYKKLKEFYDRDIIEITKEDDYEKYEKFVKKHPKFIKKSNGLSCGRGIEIINTKGKDIKKIFDNILKYDESVVCEELINQHEKLAIFHPESVNTVRIIPFIEKDGKAVIKYSFMKIGQGSSFIDNGGAGGILCQIDDKTGKIKTHGYDENNKCYKFHPDTCITFKGYKLPDWESAKELAIKASKKIKDGRLIGWDLTYTKDNKWIIIEGNGHTQFIGQQICDKKGKKKEFEKLIDYEGLKKEKNKDYKYKFSVIMPVYNLGKFLEESIKSILGQTIGFEENIEIILVNDGSTDNTDEICEKYSGLYPKNIKYILKENGGVSSARNEGIKFAKGKYINFFDGDDKWNKDAFEKVWDFFEERDHLIEVVTARKKYFDSKTGYTTLDNKFKAGLNIIDINKNPEYIVLSVSSSFFLKKAIENSTFDERLSYGEDSKFIIETILNKEKYGVVKDAIYMQRKRFDNSSATQISNTKITKYTNTIEYYYMHLYELSLKKYNELIPFIKHVLINGIKYRINSEIPEGISEETKKEYIEKVLELLSKIDNKTIIDTKDIDYNVKTYMLKLNNKENYEKDILVKENKLYYENKLIGKISGKSKLYITKIESKNKDITIRGNINIPNYVEFDKVYVNIYGKNIPLKLSNNNLSKKSFDNKIINEIKEFSIAIKRKRKVKIKFLAEYNKEKLKLEINLDEDIKNNKKIITKIIDKKILKIKRK